MVAFNRYRRRGFKKVAVGAKPKRVYRKRTYKPKVSFAKRVNAIISRNVENKVSTSLNFNSPICIWSGINPNWFIYNWNTNFNMLQGTSQNTRIGNTIKLKRWILKGQIAPRFEVNPSTSTSTNLRYSNQGTCKLFLLKRKNGDDCGNYLPQLFQNGSSYFDPTGTSFDQLLPINKDHYKVYWSRSFKLSPSQPIDATSGQNLFWANNDFKCVANFGLDITKYIGKNAHLKYDDNTNLCELPPTMKGLTLAAIWCPYVGAMVSTPSNSLSYYQLTFSSHYEYEDA